MRILYLLHAFFHRHFFWLERLIIAAGFTALLAELFRSRPVYPTYWDTALLVGVFFMLLFWPSVGYFGLLAAAIYPISDASIYLAVLVAAIALIGYYWFLPNLGLVLLVLGTPFLNGIYLAWLAPLLGGLWWGAEAGFLAGLFGALWGKILFGALGLPPDWLGLAGLYPDLARVLAHFEGLDSRQLLETLGAPLLISSTTLLYHLLQASTWALVGWLIGRIVIEDRAQYHRPRSTLVLLLGGSLLMGIFHLLLFLWIGPKSLANIVPGALVLNALTALLVASLAEALSFFFEYPWSARIRIKIPGSPAELKASENESPSHALPYVSAPESPVPDEPRTDDHQDSLIMIELD